MGGGGGGAGGIKLLYGHNLLCLYEKTCYDNRTARIDHQMCLSKSKCWHSNNCLPFKSALFHENKFITERNIYKRHHNENFGDKRLLKMLSLGST